MKKNILALLGICAVMAVTGCSGNSVSQEEYESLATERDELSEKLKEKENETLEKVTESLSVIDGMAFSENENMLFISICHDVGDTELEELGHAIVKIKDKDWFDFDFIVLEAMSKDAGLLWSMEINMNTLEDRTYEWYLAQDDQTEDSQGDETSYETMYQDENIVVKYTGITGSENDYDVNFEIENLSDKTLTVQFRETSVNGIMVDPIGSIEIAPGKKALDGMTIWSEDAEKCPKSSIENIETKFRVFEWDGDISYETESITIVNNQ